MAYVRFVSSPCYADEDGPMVFSVGFEFANYLVPEGTPPGAGNSESICVSSSVSAATTVQVTVMPTIASTATSEFEVDTVHLNGFAT